MYKKDYKKVYRIGIILFISTVFYVIYFYLNYINSGYITGKPRQSNTVFGYDFIHTYYYALQNTLSPFLGGGAIISYTLRGILNNFINILSLGIFFFYFFKKFNYKSIHTIFSIVALFYCISIFIFRYNVHFDMFNNRLLLPGGMLMVIAIYMYIMNYANRLTKYTYFSIISFSILLYGYTFFTDEFSQISKENNYITFLENKKNQFKKMPRNGLLLDVSPEIRFLRTDVTTFYSDFYPFIIGYNKNCLNYLKNVRCPIYTYDYTTYLKANEDKLSIKIIK